MTPGLQKFSLADSVQRDSERIIAIAQQIQVRDVPRLDIPSCKRGTALHKPRTPPLHPSGLRGPPTSIQQCRSRLPAQRARRLQWCHLLLEPPRLLSFRQPPAWVLICQQQKQLPRRCRHLTFSWPFKYLVPLPHPVGVLRCPRNQQSCLLLRQPCPLPSCTDLICSWQRQRDSMLSHEPPAEPLRCPRGTPLPSAECEPT